MAKSRPNRRTGGENKSAEFRMRFETVPPVLRRLGFLVSLPCGAEDRVLIRQLGTGAHAIMLSRAQTLDEVAGSLCVLHGPMPPDVRVVGLEEALRLASAHADAVRRVRRELGVTTAADQPRQISS